MQAESRITGLIEKILNNQATRQEKEELFKLINSEEYKDQISNWLKDRWEDTEYESLDIESKSILERIHRQIGVNEATAISSPDKKSKIRHLVRTTLKYAAVCIVACGIEWVILTHDKDNIEQGKVSQLNQYNEITVPIGSKSFVVLADSTKVWLNAGAKFRYPSNFLKNTREVFLEGEAFFDVSKNKDMPFFVNMSGVSIKVLGTQFNVKAYADEKSIAATLVEGSIEVVGLKSDKENEKDLLLKPGQKLILSKDKKTYQLSQLSQQNATSENISQEKAPVKITNAKVITLQDTEPEISWRDDKLIFHKERFEDVKIKFERWYGVTIDVQDPEILNYRFTGTFDEETFEQALMALRKAAKFDYMIKKKHVTIKRN